MNEHIQVSVRNHIGFLTLHRPKALNSLSLDMVRTITQALLAWRSDPDILAVAIGSSSEKAFCAGGDIRFFHDCGKSTVQGGSALLEDFFTEEYALNHLIHYYPKPFIALMNGIVMGGGMGIAQCASAGRLRIVTENTRIAMPEVHIGLFPDVGGSYFLSRTPGHIGTYLGVTGATIRAADAIYAGLADVFLPAAQLQTVISMLESDDAAGIRDAILSLAAPFKEQADPAKSTLAQHRALIDKCFGANDLASIIDDLAREAGPFSLATLQTMRQGSPLMMHVTLAQVQRASSMSLEECLRMERTMVRRCFEHGEVLEGVRARVIDKDNLPCWSTAAVDEVTPGMISRFFESAWPEYAHPLREIRAE